MLEDLGDGPFTIAFDIGQMKPGCVLLQASYGATPDIASVFDTGCWLLSPTPELRVYEITKAQLEKLIERVHAHHSKRGAATG